MFSGYGAIENYSDGTVGELVEWSKPYLSNKQCNIIDKRLGNDFPRERAQKFAEIILRCLNLDPKERPTMSEVESELERLVQYAESSKKKNSELLYSLPRTLAKDWDAFSHKHNGRFLTPGVSSRVKVEVICLERKWIDV